jgi:hypothetical protein
MNIKEYYEQQSKNTSWYANYFQCGKNDDGSIFKFLNTNYRNILAFEYYFKEFSKLENIPRNKWEKKETTGQLIAKQYVSGMTETFLFSSARKNNELVYSMTARGKAFKDMLANDFTNNEKLFLIILFIANASFLKTPRYIIKNHKKYLNILQNQAFHLIK